MIAHNNEISFRRRNMTMLKEQQNILTSMYAFKHSKKGS